ncbi:NADH-ubiquinone oxidoreductase family protein [Ceratobasidium sp. AG-Ba]|nr:NADH-ubiquinone oxidoreductase family protein [Ceratobasidium sp. AG-Ba]
MVAGVARKSLFQTWYAVEAIPIYAVVVGAVGGAGWYLSRLARGPDVIWDRRGNPTPWMSVQQNMQTKMMSVNQKFDKVYVHSDPSLRRPFFPSLVFELLTRSSSRYGTNHCAFSPSLLSQSSPFQTLSSRVEEALILAA